MIRGTSLLALLLLAPGAAAPAWAATQPAAPGFRVEGEVDHPQNYSVEVLEKLPATKLDVVYTTEARPVSASFTGALLWDILSAAGIATDPKIKNDILRKEVIATGSDGYQAVFSLGELDPKFGGQPVIVAYQQNGAPLPGAAGSARIIAPGDKAGGRDVSSLVSLRVVEVR